MDKHLEIGILGGGQLGRMLIQAGIDFALSIHILDPKPNAPCHSLADSFTQGSLLDYDTVYQFGKNLDLITIEIESVNTEALEALEAEGVRIYPQPSVIRIIQDKREQKQFYLNNNIPTAEFVLTETQADLEKHKDFLPAVHKLGKGGYDGKGVQAIRSKEEIHNGFDAPALLEKQVDFEKELAVIVARNRSGATGTFPPAELVFHPEQNLVEYLFAPADISAHIAGEATRIAEKVAESMGITGTLAVEMFLTKDGSLLVNEVAPRPHNSGHHTIKANHTSQYEQHWRCLLNYPLGTTDPLSPAAMVNLLGAPGYKGPVSYESLDKALEIPGVYIHLYNKPETRPYRKMGHATILEKDPEEMRRKAYFVKDTIKIKHE